MMQVVEAIIGLCITLTCLCRMAHMTADTTRPLIRWATAMLATAGVVLTLGATLFPAWQEWSRLLLASAILFIQASTAIYWSRGLPSQFARPIVLTDSETRHVWGMGKK